MTPDRLAGIPAGSRVYYVTSKDNVASQRAARSAGLQPAGDIRRTSPLSLARYVVRPSAHPVER